MANTASLILPAARHLTKLKRRRKFWLQIHLWLGLLAGSVLLIAGLTGSIITFWQELDAVLNPTMHQVSAAAEGAAAYRPLDEIVAAADAAMPADAKRGYIYYPRHAEQAFWLFYEQPAGGEARQHTWNAFVDPYTARVTGIRLWEHADDLLAGSLIGFVFKLHYALLLDWDDVSWIVGTVAILSAISVLTGLILWWPLTGRWRSALTIKPRASVERFNHDLHKTLGFYSGLILFGVLLSGVYFNFGEPFRWLVDCFSPTKPLEQFHSVARPGPKPLSADQALMLADQATPAGQWYWLKLPDAADGTFIFTKHVDFGGVFRGRWQIVLDQSDGKILHVATPLSGGAGNVFLQWQWPLHSGQFLRLPGRVLVLASGLVCAALFVTGLIRWLQKRRAAKQVRIRKPN
ncbi:PepSY-associated TM helix domain-containing protein [Methylomonas sp. YC3]